MIATMHPAQQYFDNLFDPTDTVCLTFISTTKTYASGIPSLRMFLCLCPKSSPMQAFSF